MQVIALAQQKGGVGKSTLAIHMAVELCRRGKRVSILDLDPQATVIKWASRRDSNWECPEVSSTDPQRLEGKLMVRKHQEFDYVFLDLPGRRAAGVNEGMRHANFVIIPSRPFDIDLEASGDTVAAAQRIGVPYAFAMTVVPPVGKRAREFSAILKERGLPVIPAIVIERITYPDAIAEGLGVAEYEPNGKAAAEMAAFTTAVLKGAKK
jgi:chromosome partitioning protein